MVIFARHNNKLGLKKLAQLFQAAFHILVVIWQQATTKRRFNEHNEYYVRKLESSSSCLFVLTATFFAFDLPPFAISVSQSWALCYIKSDAKIGADLIVSM